MTTVQSSPDLNATWRMIQAISYTDMSALNTALDAHPDLDVSCYEGLPLRLAVEIAAHQKSNAATPANTVHDRQCVVEAIVARNACPHKAVDIFQDGGLVGYREQLIKDLRHTHNNNAWGNWLLQSLAVRFADQSVLLFAMEGSGALVKMLLDKGADPKIRDSYLLPTAVRRNHSAEVMQLLLDYGADARANDSLALQCACEWNNTKLCDVLYEHSDPATALHHLRNRFPDQPEKWMLLHQRVQAIQQKMILREAVDTTTNNHPTQTGDTCTRHRL